MHDTVGLLNITYNTAFKFRETSSAKLGGTESFGGFRCLD